MTHAPKFWASKLPLDLQGKFWGLLEYGFNGESAYYRVIDEQEDHWTTVDIEQFIVDRAFC